MVFNLAEVETAEKRNGCSDIPTKKYPDHGNRGNNEIGWGANAEPKYPGNQWWISLVQTKWTVENTATEKKQQTAIKCFFFDWNDIAKNEPIIEAVEIKCRISNLNIAEKDSEVSAERLWREK